MFIVPSYRRHFTHTWSGTTIGPFPAGGRWGGSTNGGTMTAGDIAVTGGVCNSSAPTGTASNAHYFSGRCYQDPMATNLHWAETTIAGTSAAYPRGIGAGVGGSDNVFTNGVYVIGADFSGTSTRIISKVGTTFTEQATGDRNWAAGERVRLVLTHNGTNFVYTCYANGTTQVVQWIDTGGIINPGVWVTPAFGGVRSSGVWFASQGANAFACGDN